MILRDVLNMFDSGTEFIVKERMSGCIYTGKTIKQLINSMDKVYVSPNNLTVLGVTATDYNRVLITIN